MKTSSLLRTLAASCLVVTCASAQVIVSNVGSVPLSNVTLNQSTFSDASNTQARDLSGSVRSVSQTFTWNSDLALDGVGLRLATAQNTLDAISEDRVWRVDVQQISGNAILAAASVQSTIASVSFTLTPAAVAPDSYLYLNFTDDLALTNGMTYGLIIYAEGAGDPGQRLFFSRSADSSAYAGGIGAQGSFSGTGPYAGVYGGQNFSLGFYMTTIPEPSTTALVGGAGALLVVALLRRRRGN